MAQTHKCSPCGNEFASEGAYLDHECNSANGANPKSVDYLVKTTTPNFNQISKSALKRGK